MSAISVPLPFSGMSKEKRPETLQVNIRILAAVIDRVNAYKKRHHMRPTTTQIVESALIEWLDKHEPELPKKKHA